MDAEVNAFEEEALKSWGAALTSRSRKDRQVAARALSIASAAVPQKVAPLVGAVVSAVMRPEAQTRWDALDTLANLAPYVPEETFQAFEGVQAALFDEESGLVRLNAFKFLVALGSVGPAWSLEVWPLVDEALQCLHGDPEFDEMLMLLLSFVRSNIDPSVRQAVVDRLAFDAQSGKGALSIMARRVIEAAC